MKVNTKCGRKEKDRRRSKKGRKEGREKITEDNKNG